MLTKLAEDASDDWTVKDVLETVVRPATTGGRKSYAETLGSEQTSDNFIFVSAPRSSNFKDLVCNLIIRV